MESEYSEDFGRSLSGKAKQLALAGGEIRSMFMLGQRLKRSNPSLDLIDLSLGNPDLDPPSSVKHAFQTLLAKEDHGEHRYMDAAGLPESRAYLAQELSASEGVSVVPDSVYLTVGAAGGLQILLRSFVDNDDDVLIFAPYFPEYAGYLINYGARAVVVGCDAQHQPNVDDFAQKITAKTKAVILNSPNNPTGVAYTRESLQGIFHVLREHRKKTGRIVHVISDEPYWRVLYNPAQASHILQMYEFSWIVRSFSKDLGLAGERIGYIAWSAGLAKWHPSLIDVLRNSARVLGFVSAPRLMQRLIPHVFHAQVDLSVYQERVNLFVKLLQNAGMSVVQPDAGFFVFPKAPIQDDPKFCEELVSHGVLSVPGSAFGVPGYFRVSLTQDKKIIESAANRIILHTKSLLNSAK